LSGKKGRLKIRLILDARLTNRMFADPPGVSLCTAEGFSKIEVEVPSGIDPYSDSGRQWLESLGLCMGLADVKDCFHRMIVPPELSDFFCFPPIRARDVGLSGHIISGRALEPDDYVWPCARALPCHTSSSLDMHLMA